MALNLQGGMAPLLQVYDMPTSVAFYRNVLGFTVSSGSALLSDNPDDVNWILLDRPGMQLMLNTAYEKDQRPPQPDRQQQAAHQDVTLYFGDPDIEAAYAHVVGQGIGVAKPSTTGYGWKAINFSDPDGYGICIHWPQQ